MVDIHTTTKQFLRVDEVVEILGVPERTVYYWCANGDIQAVQIGRTWRVAVEDIRRRLNGRPPQIGQTPQ